MANPKSIRKAMLSPTDKTSFSNMPSLFNLRRKRMSSPGMKLRRAKPKACLKTGISKNIVRAVDIRRMENKAKPMRGACFCLSMVYSPSQAVQYVTPSLQHYLIGIFFLNKSPGILCYAVQSWMAESSGNPFSNLPR